MAVFDVTIKEYLREIDEAPLLSWEEECELAEDIIDYDDPQARDTLVRSNLRLVVNIAKKFVSRGMSLGDLIEEGNLGLIRAVDSFDPVHGVRFSTYAAWWIKQSIKRSLLLDSGPVSIPTYMVELVNQYRQVASDLQTKLSREPEPEEIAEEMKQPLRKVRVISQIINTGSVGMTDNSAIPSQSQAENMLDENIEMPEDELVNAEEIAKAVKLLGEIEPREAEVLTLRFGLSGEESLTLKEIGAKLGLTRERARQIQRSALKKLNEFMNCG